MQSDDDDGKDERRRRRRLWSSTTTRAKKKINRTFLGVWPSTTIGLCQGGAAIFSNPISRMRCMFFAILRSRMRSNSESPLKFFSSFSSSLSLAVAACCPGVVGGENRRIVVVSMIADIFSFFFRGDFFALFLAGKNFYFFSSLFCFFLQSRRIEDEIFNVRYKNEHTHKSPSGKGSYFLLALCTNE
jgi:hypothetical protein